MTMLKMLGAAIAIRAKRNHQSVFLTLIGRLFETRKLRGGRKQLSSYSKDLVDEFNRFSDGSFLHSNKIVLSSARS